MKQNLKTGDKTMKHMRNTILIGLLVAMIAATLGFGSAKEAEVIDKLIGQPADIAPSAYQYRADRKADENPPESWLAVMRFAGQPLNKPADPNAPEVKKVLCSFLWEEIRPVQELELIWPAEARRRPAPEDLVITTLDNKGAASSWWNNLETTPNKTEATLSNEGKTFTYIEFETPTCGIIISLGGDKVAANYDVPTVRVLVLDVWKKMTVEIEWGFDPATAGNDYSGRIETYDGRVSGLRPLDSDPRTKVPEADAWSSAGKGAARRGVKFDLLYMGTSQWRKVYPYTTQSDDVARTIVTVWTQSGNFSFLASDLENGPILAPEYGFFVRRTTIPSSFAPVLLASKAASAREFIKELRTRNLSTIRQQTRIREEQTWAGAVTAYHGDSLPPYPKPPAGSEPAMQVQVPCEQLTAQWNLGAWHLLRHFGKHPVNGRLWFNDYPYGILASETYLILHALNLMGYHKAAEDGFDQWVSLPMQIRITPAEKVMPRLRDKHDWRSLPDRPSGLFTDGEGCFTHAEGPPGTTSYLDGVHAFGPGYIGWALVEHYQITDDKEWFKAHAPRIKANVEWMLRQRRTTQNMLPGGERLWCKGLQPALQGTPDSGGLWMQFYLGEALYWLAIRNFAEALATIDPSEGERLRTEAEAYRKDLLAAVERTHALSPVVPVRDGTYHSVIPFACYVRGLSTGAWGWMRDGSGRHVGPMYWETDASAAALISPAGLLPVNDVRVQGYLDVLEDRLFLENIYVGQRNKGDWFLAGWQHQWGLQRTPNIHLDGDDIPVFLRSFLNGYAADILPKSGYIFNEHTTNVAPGDKIFEEAAFIERFRNLLVMEDGQNLWLARATPRVWLEQGKKIIIRNAPTHFGTLAYEIVSDVDNGKINATVEMPSRKPPKTVLLRFRHPKSLPIKSVRVNGKSWKDFDPARETISLHDVQGTVKIGVSY